ncbi:DMT family transporter [Mesorhizobium sp. SP-1A]|uniref:DMT family transporter n=1 Tax=Mesorhizobium sp. SP-1A TaxID=3077840 RepID=UPI0028F71FBB|nr:DMT family transporter [Mesorhizobium sp. SP-1A]
MAVSIEDSHPANRAFWPAFAALLGGALAMGISPIFVRLSDVGPFASAFYRVFLALPVLYAWMRIEQKRLGSGRPARRFSPAVVATGLAFAGDLFFWHLAILNTSIANSTFFATTAPVWVGLIGWVALGRRVAPMTIVGLLLCLAGGGALVWQSLALSPGHLVGDLYAELTAVFFGIYFLTVEWARRTEGAATITFHMSLITAALLAIVAIGAQLFYGQRLFPSSATGWLVLLCLATISHAGGQGLLSLALGSLPSMFSSLVIFLEAVAAAALAWLILGEEVTQLQGLGGLAILFGIWLARPRAARSDTVAPANA